MSLHTEQVYPGVMPEMRGYSCFQEWQTAGEWNCMRSNMSRATAQAALGFGALGSWGAMAFPCCLLHPCSHTLLPPSPTRAKPKQPQKLAGGAATLLGCGQMWGMENGRYDLHQGAQKHDSLRFLWQPRFT